MGQSAGHGAEGSQPLGLRRSHGSGPILRDVLDLDHGSSATSGLTLHGIDGDEEDHRRRRRQRVDVLHRSGFAVCGLGDQVANTLSVKAVQREGKCVTDEPPHALVLLVVVAVAHEHPLRLVDEDHGAGSRVDRRREQRLTLLDEATCAIARVGCLEHERSRNEAEQQQPADDQATHEQWCAEVVGRRRDDLEGDVAEEQVARR